VTEIPQDDWTDQDLLTRDEATHRILTELERVNRELDDPEIDRETRSGLVQRRQSLELARAALHESQ
jgi:hypothetical protein